MSTHAGKELARAPPEERSDVLRNALRRAPLVRLCEAGDVTSERTRSRLSSFLTAKTATRTAASATPPRAFHTSKCGATVMPASSAAAISAGHTESRGAPFSSPLLGGNQLATIVPCGNRINHSALLARVVR